MKKIKEKDNVRALEPINRFLNMVDENGKPKYELAGRLRKYFLANPDPATNSIRMCNSLVHELRWHKLRSEKYLSAFESDKKIEMFDNNGRQMGREECYTAYIAESHTCYLVVSKIQEVLIQKVLPTIDGDIFTFDQYDDYVKEVEGIVKGMGYGLFPDKVEVIKPL